MNQRVLELISDCITQPPAELSSVECVMARLRYRLPDDYVKLVTHTDGFDGFVGPNYTIFQPCEKLHWQGEAEYMPLPFLLVFASNGGGEAYAYDTRESPPPIVNVPFIGMEEKIIRVMGRNMLEFLERLHRAPLFP